MLANRQGVFITLATMAMIAVSAYIVERYFPSPTKINPPLRPGLRARGATPQPS